MDTSKTFLGQFLNLRFVYFNKLNSVQTLFYISSPLLLVFLLTLILPTNSFAQLKTKPVVTLDNISVGTLLFKNVENSEENIPAPLLYTRYDIDLSGPVVNTTLTQYFQNKTKKFLEGIYAFPLPEQSAIHGFRMRVGKRFIEGKIQEKTKAKKIFETARTRGRKAALLIQKRPNLFTNAVTNIGPGETIVIQLKFQEIIKPVNEIFTLRLPLVAAPRYEPYSNNQKISSQNNPEIFDKEKIKNKNVLTKITDQNLTAPRTLNLHNPVNITVKLNAGFPLGNIYSASHKIVVKRENMTKAVIRLATVDSADRDFLLSWNSNNFKNPKLFLFKETIKDGVFHAATITPPRRSALKSPMSRNIIFIQDISGSMDGHSIKQAKKALKFALERLKPNDRFNIIFFNDQARALSPTLMKASRHNLNHTLKILNSMKASGGTEMLAALSLGLGMAEAIDDKRVKQIVFLTDGAVSNERELYSTIQKNLGNSRLFTIGIGSAPNDYFMKTAARIGRGSFVFISNLETAGETIKQFLKKIESPVLTNLKLNLPDQKSLVTPSPLPDLYAGEPIIITFKSDKGQSGIAELEGVFNSEKIKITFKTSDAVERVGIAKLWAGRYIRDLELKRTNPWSKRFSKNWINEEILRTGLKFQVMSSQTSFVAVDKDHSSRFHQFLFKKNIPNNLPAGWNREIWFPETILGPSFGGSIFPELNRKNKKLKILEGEDNGFIKVSLPQTGLDWRQTLYLGVLILTLATVLSGLLIIKKICRQQ